MIDKIRKGQRLIQRNINERVFNPIRVRGKQKIFVIGRNKTGTTSLTQEFLDFGFIVGNEKRAHKILRESYYRGDFKKIINFCKTAQVFQDVPFSWPETYKYLDKAYPGSKFILSVRDPKAWYRSMVNHMARRITNGDRIPTIEDVKCYNNGYYWKDLYDPKKGELPSDDPFNKEAHIRRFKRYNSGVINYFKNTTQLLTIDVSRKSDYSAFCDFINVPKVKENFSWNNKGNYFVES